MQNTDLLSLLSRAIKASTTAEDEMLTVKDACHLLKVSRWTIRRMCRNGLIKYVKLSAAKSGSVRIFRSSVIAYIDRLGVGGKA